MRRGQSLQDQDRPEPATLVEVPAVPWPDLQEAVAYVRSRRALLVEGQAWRVEMGPLNDITITIRGVADRQLHAPGPITREQAEQALDAIGASPTERARVLEAE